MPDKGHQRRRDDSIVQFERFLSSYKDLGISYDDDGVISKQRVGIFTRDGDGENPKNAIAARKIAISQFAVELSRPIAFQSQPFNAQDPPFVWPGRHARLQIVDKKHIKDVVTRKYTRNIEMSHLKKTVEL